MNEFTLMAYVAFTVITFPITALAFYGIFKAALKKQSWAILLVACIGLSTFVIYKRSIWSIDMRMIVPILPLLGLGLCQVHKDLAERQAREARLRLGKAVDGGVLGGEES